MGGMTNIDEARKRLESLAGELERLTGDPDEETARDIRTVLDALDAAVRERDEALAAIERVRNYAESIPRHRDRDVNPALSERSWLTAQDVLHQLAAVPADVLRERDAALLERVADEMHATLTAPDRVRPRRFDAEVSTDFANDIEWAVQIVRAKAGELRKEQSDDHR